jgi:outer membrane lipoprotein-sorting protein
VRSYSRCLAATLILPVLLLSGCSLIYSKRKLPIPKAPSIVQTVTPEDLVTRLNQRWAAIDSLNATVEIQASVLKSKEGVAKDYTTIRGHILMRKPEMLRVLGQFPVLGTRMFDMASDGKNFTLFIPSKSMAVKGPNEVTKKSANRLENLRPGFFVDAMIVRGLEPDDLYAVVADTETLEDAARKHLFTVPEYVLSISRRNPGSQQLTPVRVVVFHRDDLMPYQQDIYDKEGNLETQVDYADYQTFEGSKYPSKITIKRPLEDYQVVLTVEKVAQNQPLTDDQFQIKIPEGIRIQNLDSEASPK